MKNNSRKKGKNSKKKLLNPMDLDQPILDPNWLELSLAGDPLLRPIAELPQVPHSFYFEELLNWTYNGFEAKKCNIYTVQDYITRHEVFPPEQAGFLTGEAPFEERWDSMTLEDLSFKQQPGIDLFFKEGLTNNLRSTGRPVKDRIFINSPPLHVFLISILEKLKEFPDEFISSYAKQRAISGLLKKEEYAGEYKCIELFVEEMENHINERNFQLIPTLYHFRDHGFIMSEDFEKPEKMDTKVTPEYTYEFGFSKQTSDSFVRQLITILEERKQFILKINNISLKPPPKEKFEKLIDCFRDKDDYKKIISILETKGYIEKDNEGQLKWEGVNKKQREPSELISALITQRYLVTENRSAIAKAFLNSIKSDIPEGTIRKPPPENDISELDNVIPERSKLS